MKHMKRQFWAVILFFAAALSLAPLLASAEPQKIEVPGIANFSKIEGDKGAGGAVVGFGGATQPVAMPWLKSNGFATVINLRYATEPGVDVEGNRAAAEAAGIKYVHMPFDTKIPEPDVVPAFLAAVADKKNQPIYIHCNSATRVATLWMISRVLNDGWTVEAATTEAKLIAGKPDHAIPFAVEYLAKHGKTAAAK